MTTFRIDGDYGDGRHPDEVIFTGNLFEDVQRRDFTVNALCWNEQAGLIDYAGGEEDIERRLIRCVGEPDVRFGEDALRILRALRFSAALDFDIDPDTAKSVHKNRALLSQIAVERILTELKKLICGPRAEGVLMEYRDVLEVFMPELGALSADEYALAVRQASLITPVPELRLAALMGDLEREAALGIALRLKFSRLSRGFIDGIIEHRGENMPLDRVGMRRVFNELGTELAAGLVEYQSARLRALTHMVIQKNDCVSLKQLAVKGDDVFRVGVTRRQTGQCLNELLEDVMADKLPNEREALLDAVRQSMASRAGKQPRKKSRRGQKREETIQTEEE